LILRPLSIHDVLVLAVAGHGRSLRQAERLAIGLQHRVLLLARMRLHLPQAHDHSHDLGVVAVGLGLGVDVANVVRDALLFLFQALDALDEQSQLVGRDGAFRHSPNLRFASVKRGSSGLNRHGKRLWATAHASGETVTETLAPRARKVKILATLGPASSDPKTIRKLMLAGADAFRINMSHGDQKQKAKLVEAIRALEKEFHRP